MNTNSFELGIPTHIRFTLYRYDYIDSVLISILTRECPNLSVSEGIHTVAAAEFKNAVMSSRRLRREALKANTYTPGNRELVNSVFFLWQILTNFPNMELLSFNISEEKEYTRTVKVNGADAVNFAFSIEEGYMDLPMLLGREELDRFNRIAMSAGIISNKYLNRSSYFYAPASVVIEILGTMTTLGYPNAESVLGSIDAKIEEDDPIMLIKTDYTPY
jgi:hypothetical protein